MLDIHCRAQGLSRRERELVMLLVDGLDTTAVARRMGITTNTVQDHLKSVFAKVHVHSRRELVATLNGHGGSPAVPDARSGGRAY
jgi:DNA-binding CsgD family transcriptional regulator